jgi:Zn-dependent oligopeptidase
MLIAYYEDLYSQKYSRKPKINRFREKWAMQDVIDSVGYDRARELLDYYFRTGKNGHPLNFFFYNFDRMDQVEKEREKDRINRSRLRQQTKTLVEGGQE